MSTRQIIEVLKTNKEYLSQNYGVESIGLFGSFARGEETADSDIDLLVRFRTPDYLAWCNVVSFLENSFQRKVDLVTDGKHLSDRFRKRVTENIIYA